MRSPTAGSPEELDRLLEDAVVLRDPAALAGLFTPSGVLVVDRATAARGRVEIGRIGPLLWRAGHSYVAVAGRVETAGDLALVLTDGTAHVARRARDGTWRLVITVLGDGCRRAPAAGPSVGAPGPFGAQRGG